MRKKYIAILLLLIVVVLPTSLTLAGCRKLGFAESDKLADERLENILDSLEAQDKEAIKNMFSKQALEEAIDFDDSLDYLFEFFQGELVSWERDRFTSGGAIEDGKKSVKPITWYTVTTNEHVYKFFMIDYTENSINPDYLGLYTLRVIKAAEEDTQFGYWQDMNIPGIYKPE